MSEVLALVPYVPGTAGGQRTTIECWLPALARHGVHVALEPYESNYLHAVLYQRNRIASKSWGVINSYGRRLRVLRGLRSFEAVFIYREAALVGPALLERWITHQGVPVIYCLDDPLFVPYSSPVNGRLSLLKFPSKVARICALASAVVVNSQPIERFVRRYNDNVWLIPSLVDESCFTYRPNQAHAPVCLGWSGSATSAPNLDVLTDPLRILNERVPFSLRLIGADVSFLGDVPCMPQNWALATEVEDLRRFDIGLVPMSDHPWNEWKFSLKLAQYMMLGIPAVSSPVGSIPDIIEHGVNGFLASTSDEWVQYLEVLITDEDLRQKMGAAAADYAHRHFTLSANEDTIVAAFRSVLDQR
jgi:glycosyltransferase involved in cell wall biosynthesis